MISMRLIIELVVGGLLAYVAWWGLGRIALPEPFGKIATVLLVLVIFVWLCNLLLPLAGHAPLFRY